MGKGQLHTTEAEESSDSEEIYNTYLNPIDTKGHSKSNFSASIFDTKDDQLL